MTAKISLTLAACLILGACATGPSPRDGTPPEASLANAPSSAPTPPATGAEVMADPTRLKGMTAAQVTTLMGPPDFLRREKPAEVWQYYGNGCILDLFLYGDGATKNVAYVDLRGRGADAAPDRHCLSTRPRGGAAALAPAL